MQKKIEDDEDYRIAFINKPRIPRTPDVSVIQ
jgi:hypothetical protein